MKVYVLAALGAGLGLIVIGAWWQRRWHRAAIARIDREIRKNTARRIADMDKADPELAARTLQKRAAIEADLKERRRTLENPQIVQPHDHVAEFRRRA